MFQISYLIGISIVCSQIALFIVVLQVVLIRVSIKPTCNHFVGVLGLLFSPYSISLLVLCWYKVVHLAVDSGTTDVEPEGDETILCQGKPIGRVPCVKFFDEYVSDSLKKKFCFWLSFL